LFQSKANLTRLVVVEIFMELEARCANVKDVVHILVIKADLIVDHSS
jgi:hypothetical protein